MAVPHQIIANKLSGKRDRADQSTDPEAYADGMQTAKIDGAPTNEVCAR